MKHQWIEQRLRQLGLTKQDLARALELPAPRVSEILKNKRQLKLSEIPHLAQILRLSQATLLSLLLAPDQRSSAPPPLIRALHDIWVIGHQPASAKPKIDLWPTDHHYLLRLPLDGVGAFAAPTFWALEHRRPNGTLEALRLFQQNQPDKLPQTPNDLNSASDAQFHFTFDITS